MSGFSPALFCLPSFLFPLILGVTVSFFFCSFAKFLHVAVVCDNSGCMASQLTIPATVPGRFGPYGGRYVPETLMVPLLELERAYEIAKSDAVFQAKFQDLLKNFAGRPTPLQFASRLTAYLSEVAPS